MHTTINNMSQEDNHNDNDNDNDNENEAAFWEAAGIFFSHERCLRADQCALADWS